MSTFHVGQRVRIVGATDAEAKHLIGRETVITHCGGTNWQGVQVYRTDIPADDGNGLYVPFWSFPAYQLEPLTDPGRKVVSWAACDWKPEHLRQPA